MSPPTPTAPPPQALLRWPKERWLHRIFRGTGAGGAARSPIHFARSLPGEGNRFEAPDREFGAMHAGASLRCAVIEALVRPGEGPDGTLVRREWLGERELAGRSAATLGPPRDLRLLKLHDAGLLALGLDARIGASLDYGWTQRRALDLFQRFDVDGFAWRSRLDNGEIAVVLFEERVGTGFSIGDQASVASGACAGTVRAILDELGCRVAADSPAPPPGC